VEEAPIPPYIQAISQPDAGLLTILKVKKHVDVNNKTIIFFNSFIEGGPLFS
jgi:hypothetical protein